MSLPQEAETLKAEGNALYTQGDHNNAIKKYTAAINIASDNAILFANRAACRLALKQYEQARKDAQKATELDPNYAKGWGRLGAAFESLSEYQRALDAYGEAIECIDAISPLSDADKRLKAQYQTSHTSMELLAQIRHFTLEESDIRNKKMPWDLAREMGRNIPAESSAHIVLQATEDFNTARSMFQDLTRLNGMTGGRRGGIAYFSNAILTDERCIIMTESGALLDDFNDYLRFEASQYSAFFSSKKPQEIIRLAKGRLRQTRNWESIRGALSFQVRVWIIWGFLGLIHDKPREELFLWYDRAYKLIELGRKEWPDVSRELRGTIFDETFLRGVQVLRMNAYMQAYEVKHLRNSGKFTLDGLMALADEIITQVENTPPEVVESMRTPHFFYLAFHRYPLAAAWSIRGYVYYHSASFESEDTILEDREWSKKSGDAYVKSADLYPEDDEIHCFMLKTAVQSYSSAKVTAREMLGVMNRIRLTYPKMQRIWKNSPSALQGAHREFIQVMDAEDQFRQELAAGKFTLDDPIMLQVQRPF